MEMVDLYDWDKQKTGRTAPRGEPLQPGDLHLIVHVCIFNSDNQMLIQQRHTAKKEWPGRWDVTVAGSTQHGDNSRRAAARELREELGIVLDLTDRRPHFTIHFEHGFDDFFLLERDIDPADLSIQSEEVLQVRWATREEIHRLLAADQFIPYYPAMIDLLFTARHGFGLDENRFARQTK